jgi:hypothetical protein
MAPLSAAARVGGGAEVRCRCELRAEDLKGGVPANGNGKGKLCDRERGLIVTARSRTSR